MKVHGNTGKRRSITIKWLLEHANHEGDECLMWPFYIDPIRGYGTLGCEGRMTKAHIFMCKLINGPRPTPKHEAAHSCGKGRDGCVHPKHLSWKTRTENQRDRQVHGTNGWGEKRGKRRRKLTPEQVEEIRLATGETATNLAVRYGVDRSTIRQIRIGKIWPATFNGKVA